MVKSIFSPFVLWFVVASLALFTVSCSSIFPTPVPTPTATPTPSPTSVPTSTPLPTATPPPTKIDLRDADALGKIRSTVSGNGLQAIDVTLELINNGPLEVNVMPGTLFHSLTPGTQDMIALESKKIVLQFLGDKVSVRVSVACANMMLEIPKATDLFAIVRGQADPDLVRLINYSGFSGKVFRIQQFAIWTITDNPSRDGYFGLGLTSGQTSGPTLDEFREIGDLFTSAGVAPTRYRAFAPPATPTPVPRPTVDLNPCGLPPGAAGLLFTNNYDRNILVTIGGGQWGTHDYPVPAKATGVIVFPPGRYTTTISVPGVGNFKFANDAVFFEAGSCPSMTVP